MKLNVQAGDTADIFAARYGLTVVALKGHNSADVAANTELERASTAVGAEQEIRGIAQLEVGIEFKAVLPKLGLGSESAVTDPAFTLFEVNIGPSVGVVVPYKNLSIGYLRTNPAPPTKRLPVKTYTLALSADQSTLYWKIAKRTTVDTGPLNRGDLVHPAPVNDGQNWYAVETRDDKAVPSAIDVMQRIPTEIPVKSFEEKPHTLVLNTGVVYWTCPTAVAAETNLEYDWLLYETRFNAKDYLKGKVALGYGLFAVPLDYRAEIVAAKDLPGILVEAFFPGMSVGEVQAVSAQTCRWRGVAGGATVYGPNSAAKQSAARTEAVIHAPQMMIMPYNYYANDVKSYAIGTGLDMEIVPGPAYRLKKFWPLWETASRSSVSSLEATTKADLAQGERLDPQWTYRSAKQPAGGEITPAYKDKIFQLGKFTNCYSVKTGVRWLGKKPQGSEDPGGGKDVLESNALLASMRSDWVEYVEEARGTSPNLVVLRELLTVTFANYFRKGRDGYQIRDMRPMDSGKIYFPPLSIPFGGPGFVDAYNALHPTATMTFEEFWRKYYAEALGKAKAELLLRYGLQLTTPNPQNFLLEFEKGTLQPTGRVIVRDIGDAKLHSEIIGVIGGGQPVIQYELTNSQRPGYLPAQTNNADRHETPEHAIAHERFDNYPLNTRTHWHQYSTFKDQYGGGDLPGGMMTTVNWGRAHYAAYVDHLATRLESPALRLPIWGKAAYERAMAALEVRHKAEADTAKEILPLALAAAGGDETQIRLETYRAVLSGRITVRNVIGAEWALELHTDEILHQALSTPEVLAKVREKCL